MAECRNKTKMVLIFSFIIFYFFNASIDIINSHFITVPPMDEKDVGMRLSIELPSNEPG